MVRKVIDTTDHRWGRTFTFTVQFLIVVALTSFSISTLPDLSNVTKKILYRIELVTVVIFTIEYTLIISTKKQNNPVGE